MASFKREDRYLVIKLKGLTDAQMVNIGATLKDCEVETVECVVVEHDWPIYEQTWDAVQRLAEGRPQRVDELEAEIERLRSAGDGLCLELEQWALTESDPDTQKALRAWAKVGSKLVNDTPAPAIPDAMESGIDALSDDYVHGWNACREAMLSADPAKKFLEHLSKCEEKVASWPNWKKRAPAPEIPEWDHCLAVSEVPAVHEALVNFSDDRTEDNAVCLVREVLSAAPAQEQE
jgi:hypothetical protein